MANLIPLEEAAQMLGVSIEDLTSMRSRGDIHGYRDGKTWKFKSTEIERYKSMHQNDVTDEPPKVGESSILSNSSLEIDAELDELVDISDVDLTKDAEQVIDDSGVGIESSSSSTIIGKPKLDPISVGDSEELIDLGDVETPDVEVAADSGLELSLDGGSEINLVEGSGISLDAVDDLVGGSDLGGSDLGGSDLNLAAESGVGLDDEIKLDVGGSDLKLESGSGIELTEGSGIELDMGGSDIMLDGGSGAELDTSATGELPSIKPDAEGELILEDSEIDLEDALNLSDEDLELSVGSSSEVSLDGSDLSLAASDTGVGVTDGSDVTLDASGSGINLGSPADSGIALDQTPQEIDISGEALELGEADIVDLGDGIIADDALLDDDLQEDDDFLLSPSESDMGEDDSGSQVIALDTEELDDGAATLVGDDDGDFETFDAADDDVDMAPIAAAKVGAPADFTIMNVLALGTIVSLLGITGVLTLDLVRNMWSWQGEYGINSPIMDFIVGMFG